MKREQLRRHLAFAIVEELGTHKRTLPNIERYVIPKLTKYNIRKDTKITQADTLISLLMIEFVMAQKDVYFQYAYGEHYTRRRKEAFMDTVFPVEQF